MDKDKEIKICLSCGKNIESQNSRSKFCSPKCNHKYWRSKNPERFRKSAYASGLRYKARKRKEWEIEKMCLKCGSPRAEGLKYCEKCREIWRKSYNRLGVKNELPINP